MSLNTSALKSRAKRLPAILKHMFGIEASHAQSLEIIAREENFPNWDAASAVARKNYEHSAIGLNDRISYRAMFMLDFKYLGFTSEQADKIYEHAINPKPGLNLISGACGSGMSTTLRTVLGSLSRCGSPIRTRDVNLAHPRAKDLPPHANGDFRNLYFTGTNGLGALTVSEVMRSDPDVFIMESEIRNPDTLNAAFCLAASGHSVWATLHANGNAGSVMRCLDMAQREPKLESSIQQLEHILTSPNSMFIHQKHDYRDCGCVNQTLGSADPFCSVCGGKGKIHHREMFVDFGCDEMLVSSFG